MENTMLKLSLCNFKQSNIIYWIMPPIICVNVIGTIDSNFSCFPHEHHLKLNWLLHMFKHPSEDLTKKSCLSWHFPLMPSTYVIHCHCHLHAWHWSNIKWQIVFEDIGRYIGEILLTCFFISLLALYSYM